MRKIMFNDKYGLTDAVLNGKKRMTRREPFFDTVSKPNYGFYTEGTNKGKLALCDGARIVHTSHYRMNEIVAVAQSYKHIYCLEPHQRLTEEYSVWFLHQEGLTYTKGWKNKMFVKSDFMPHHIRITDIRVERLQDIRYEDCMKEGIYEDYNEHDGFYVTPFYDFYGNNEEGFDTPKEAFAALIDKVSGKGTWEKNPWVFAYDFELIK